MRSATQIRQPLIDIATNLKLIVRAGVGLDNIDVAYAESKGIKIIATHEASSDSVAELVIAHLFTIARNLHISNREMPMLGNTGFKILKKKYSSGFELSGKTIGIIGFGKIGQSVARLAIGLGMQVMPVDLVQDELKIDVSLYNSEDIALSVKMKTVELEEMLTQADIITVHVPFAGKAILTAKEIEKMKTGVVIINTSRGGVVEEAALLQALNEGKVRAAGLDVFKNEPTPNKAILRHPKVSLSPHIGGSTVEAQERIGLAVADAIITFFELSK